MKILVLNLHPEKHLGGAEIQCDVIAHHLASFGNDVVYGALRASPGEVTPSKYNYRVRFIPELDAASLLDAVLDEEPDIVYWRLGRPFLPTIGAICKTTGTKLVFSVSHFMNLEKVAHTQRYRPNASLKERAKDRILQARQLVRSRTRYEGYRLVDGMVVLTNMLMPKVPRGPGFPKHVTQIYDSFEAELEGEFDWPRPYVVWVANLGHRKNPELYVEAAERCQDLDLDFVMIGYIRESKYDYIERGEVPPNLHYIGPTTPAHVNKILEGSQFLVHTCSPEGFGDNFIQAWQQSKPTITLYFDPDDVMKRNEVGFHSGDMDQFEADIRRLATDHELREAMGKRAKKFSDDFFNPVNNVRKFEQFFEQVLRD